jgi:hypothetical protein
MERLLKKANTPRGEVANYTRIVTPPQLAAIWISPEIVDQHEIVFLILVILYSETKRLEVRRLQTCLCLISLMITPM